MDEGILEVSELAGDRVVELRVVDELRVVGLITCEREVIVQGDEGPVCGVAQVVVCHGVTVVVGHQEEEEEVENQEEVEGEGENSKNTAHGWNADTHGISGNVFVHPDASSSALYPQELNPWSTTIEEPLHMSTAEKSDRPERNQDLRCQSGLSAK